MASPRLFLGEAPLGIATGSVKTHTHRGLAALEKTLEARP